MVVLLISLILRRPESVEVLLFDKAPGKMLYISLVWLPPRLAGLLFQAMRDC